MKDICYKNNFLSDVIVRVDFFPHVKVFTESMLARSVIETIKSRYPIYEPQKGIMRQLSINMSDEVGGISDSSAEFNKMVFHGENREKTITVTPESVIFSLKSYKDYNNFKLDIVDPVEKIINVEKDIQISRTGLRFINVYKELISNYEDVEKFFSPMVAKPFSKLIDHGNCSRNIILTEYLLDEIKLRVQAGIFNQNYPAKIKNKEFILDLDAYIDIPHVVSDTCGYFDKLHAAIQEKFEAYITDDLREYLNGNNI